MFVGLTQVDVNQRGCRESHAAVSCPDGTLWILLTLNDTHEQATELGPHRWDRPRRGGDFNQTGPFCGRGLYRGGAEAGSGPESRRGAGALQPNFQSDEVRGDRGIHSTDEATEIWRWRRIVTKVLPEVPDPDRAFDELWDHFGRPESWQCFPDVAPAMRAIHDAGIAVCVGSNFDSRLRQVVLGLPDPAGRSTLWSSRRKLAIANRIRRSMRPPASDWACRPGRCSAWATTSRTTCGVRCGPGSRPSFSTEGPRTA